MKKKKSITCPHCHSDLPFSLKVRHAGFCAFCGKRLSSREEISPDQVTLVSGHAPEKEPILFSIGQYEIIQSIGKGGMGEVFLAYDTSCGRRIALKKIRDDLSDHAPIRNRFLKEARITSQLTHPSIIPIYTIHADDLLTYYTMPYVRGETLKQILRRTSQQEKKGEILDPIGASVPTLTRLFINVCQAVSYAHSKNILHRDLKPENIIIGKYGEVLILDWGLAVLISGKEAEALEVSETYQLHKLTNIGKVVGTISYMAPERALGHPATIQTDIYSLGVILYQILTLKFPFKRGSLKEFQRTMHREEFQNPATIAPYRDVPDMLSRVVEKCLSPSPEYRYQTVQELIHDLESYIEGRSEWFETAALDVKNKADWEFQENVLIAEHIAITRNTEESDWVSLMISNASFQGNVRIDARLKLGNFSNGIGFLLSIPEISERHHLIDGYCIWLGSDINPSTKLLRTSVEVVYAPDIYLHRKEWYQLRIEKNDHSIHVYINGNLQFSYAGNLPLIGTHIGILSRDEDFEMEDCTVSVGGLQSMINCLAIPDAFLAQKNYDTALSEYRRIGYSFPGQFEGREAIFRAGITLIEKAKAYNYSPELLDEAMEEFEKLHNTPGGPLEYLGKGLIYEVLKDTEEEVKCFELAYRRYPRHPLHPILQEQILSRMHKISRSDRRGTYAFIFLALKHFPISSLGIHTQKLFTSVQKHWEPLFFIEKNLNSHEKNKNLEFAAQISFWLAKPYFIGEIINEILASDKPDPVGLANAVSCLIELGSKTFALSKIQHLADPYNEKLKDLYTFLTQPLENVADSLPDHLTFDSYRVLIFLLEEALKQEKFALIHSTLKKIHRESLSFDEILRLNVIEIWCYLKEKNWEEAGKLLHTYPYDLLNKESTLLHLCYGCWLQAAEGKEIAFIHFSGVLEVTFPRSWTLLSHYLIDNIKDEKGWFNKAFLWEKRQLYKQLALFYHCSGELERETVFKNLELQEYVDVET